MSGNYFENQVVIVTGAGRGLGRAHAIALAAEGASVLVNDLGVSREGQEASSSPAERVVEEITEMGGIAEVNSGDVADWQQAEEMVSHAIEKWGRLDALICNAGFLRDRMLVSMSEEEWDSVIRVHLKGHIAPARHAANHWRNLAKEGKETEGRIVMTSSGAGLMGSVGQGNYAAAKAGIALLVLQAAEEWKQYGVKVNGIAPDARTRMTEGVFYDSDVPDGWDEKDPANVSPLVVWLSSKGCDITGRMFEISGGKINLCDGWRHGQSEEVKGRGFRVDEIGEVVAGLIDRSESPESVYGSR